MRLSWLMKLACTNTLIIKDLGLSYGTIIGQYMVKILHPDRLGRIIIDGIANPDDWSQYGIDKFDSTSHLWSSRIIR